jgi:manganese transport protein
MSNHQSIKELQGTVGTANKKGFWRTLFAFLGPAYMVSVGYMDPGNWATDIAGGSKFGYQLIWVLLMSNLMALLLQTLAARLGIVKGWDLAQASRKQYHPWANYALYGLAEIAIIACDLAEIIGMAIGLKLLLGIPLQWGVVITALDTFLLLFLINKGVRKIEAFILVLVAIIGGSFLIEMWIVKPDLQQVSKGLVPSPMNNEALYIAIAIIGATVMPHNLYLHSSLVQTRKFARDENGIRKAIRFNFIDSAVALNLAFFVNAAILILAGSAFYQHGHTQVTGIQDAYILLENIFGKLAPTLFAVALIAAGQSSTITGTLAGQIVMEGYLNIRFTPWIRRLITRIIAITPILLVIQFWGENSVEDLLIFSQVVLSMQLAYAVVPLIHFNASKQIMGKFQISKTMATIAWLVALLIIVLNIMLINQELKLYFEALQAGGLFIKIILLCMVGLLFFLLVYISIKPFIYAPQHTHVHTMHTHVDTIEIKQPKPYKHMAVALEFSVYDAQIISEAVALGGIDATYTLIHAVESAGAIKMGNEIADAETLHDLEILNQYKNDLINQGFYVDTQLGYGKAAKAIAEVVNAGQYDILIIGTHGHRGIKDFIFGATVDQVRHRIHIPLFIVKPHAKSSR